MLPRVVVQFELLVPGVIGGLNKSVLLVKFHPDLDERSGTHKLNR